jgi:ketosteroid isomerase-like protein
MQDSIVLGELLAIVEAAMDPYFNDSDPNVYADLFCDEATYFDPNSSGKLERGAIREHFAAFAGQIPPLRYEILNPGVDVFGDTAVFTFNLETYDQADGTVTSRWNTTEVHKRTGDGWEMVHAHWSHM